MKLLGITDIHGDRKHFDRILAEAGAVDVILLGGDLTNFGTPDEAQYFVDRAREACPTVFAVAGNCDSPEIDDRFKVLGVSLFGLGKIHDDVGFYGVSAMPPWMGNMYEITEDEIAAALDHGLSEVSNAARHVVLSHPPPRKTKVDLTRDEAHVGSTAVRELVDRHQPQLVICGHIHEARGVDQIGGTAIVNCGPAFCGYYAIAELNEAATVEIRRAK